MWFSPRIRGFFAGLFVFAFWVVAGAQKADPPPPNPQDADPLKRELSEEQKKKNAKAFKREVSDIYKSWLENDVKWIISGEELTAFKQLSNDEERDQFIEQFWLRRDPTPDTVENETREEHYQRIAYANEHFAAGIAGWRTDRGRIYVVFGKPDSIESHPSGGSYMRPTEEGGGMTSTYPFETWRYRFIEGIGQEVEIEFVDDCMCNKYEMTMDRSKKDALLNIPNAGLTTYESMGLSSKADRFSGQSERLGKGPFTSGQNSKQFDRLDLFAKLNRPPAVKFRDLQEIVTSKIRYNLMPFDVRVDFVKVTEDTVLVPITIQLKNKDITFTEKEGVARGTVNIFGRVSTLTGRVAQTFEDTVQVDVLSSLLAKTVENASVYWKALPLRRGRYRIDIVVKDVGSSEGRVGTWSRGLELPNMGEDKGVVASSLIIADQMERVPTRNVGAGNFVIGTTKVRPRVASADGKPASFKRNQKLNFWMQVYNLGVDEKTNKSSADFEYDIVKIVKVTDPKTKQSVTTNTSVVSTKETTLELGNTGDQVTLEKTMSLASLEPGLYKVVVKVNDHVSKQVMTPVEAQFAIEQ
ncbi:MAG TPA: GWxTD domain-containing protein [Terriglobales bacterium]|nr:GWxTD domain-containing protein [Terriglobales bacterium]